MEDKIVIDLNKNLLDTNFQFLNNDNECIICKDNLDKNDDLVLINNLCKCYKAAKICKECFITWIKENKECMICRKKFINDNIDIDRVKEQAIANMLMRQTGLSATSKYKGLSLFNSIYSFYNDKESRLRSDLRKAQVRAERNELIELSYALDHTKTYAYSLDNYDYPFESKFN